MENAPSTNRAWPSTKLACGEQSYNTALAISSGLPKRPAGISRNKSFSTCGLRLISSSAIGVQIAPGTNGVNADTLSGVVNGGRSCQADDCMLAGNIGGQPRESGYAAL